MNTIIKIENLTKTYGTVKAVDDLTFESKDTIKNVIKKLLEYTNVYENKEVREISVAKWL